MSTDKFAPFTASDAALAPFLRVMDDVAEAFRRVGGAAAGAARVMWRSLAPIRRLTLAQRREAAGGNGYLDGDEYVCAACMGWLCGSCGDRSADVRCGCTARGHAKAVTVGDIGAIGHRADIPTRETIRPLSTEQRLPNVRKP